MKDARHLVAHPHSLDCPFAVRHATAAGCEMPWIVFAASFAALPDPGARPVRTPHALEWVRTVEGCGRCQEREEKSRKRFPHTGDPCKGEREGSRFQGVLRYLARAASTISERLTPACRARSRKR